MAVYFNLNLADGSHHKCSSICYGLLNELPIRVSYMLKDYTHDATVNNVLIEAKNITHIEHVISEYHVISISNSGFDIWVELKRMFDDLPMFHGAVRIMPDKNVVRVAIADNPADLVLMALMLTRTLTYALRRSGEFYWGLEMAIDRVSPRAAVIATMFGRSSSSFIKDENRRVYINSLSEANIFNPNTFGMKAAHAFMNQDASYNPWKQQPFKIKGYMRDCHYQSDGVVFNPSCPTYDNSDLADCQFTRYRKMVDCFSLVEDVDPIHPCMQVNKFNEFQNKGDDLVSTESFNETIQKIDDLRGESA